MDSSRVQTPQFSQIPVEAVSRPMVGATAIVVALAAFKLLMHLLTAGNYGLFTDELYFMAAGEHLAWGYVDMPPLTAFTAAIVRAIFGESVVGVHVLPALLGAGFVLVTGALVHELGGKRFAQLLAGLSVLTASVYLYMSSYLSMNSVEPVIWTACALVLVKIIKRQEPRLWLSFGALAGLGLLNKHTMLLFGAALVAGLLLTPARRLMANRWFVFGGLVAFLIFLPNLIWMIRNDFPMLELLANIRAAGRNVSLSPLQFMLEQVVFLNPVTLPVWLAGLVWFLFDARGKTYRVLGLAYLVTLVLLLVTDGRVYYVAPAYAILFAGGGLAIERWAEAKGRSWMRPALVTVMVAGGVLLAPLMLPVLQPETLVRYEEWLPIGVPRVETAELGPLSQVYADRFGWPEMAQATAAAYNSLPEDVRAKTAIWGNDYGAAGAIDFFGPKLGLPKAISGHLAYWYWGPRGYTGESVLALGENLSGLEQVFASCEPRGSVYHPYSMPRQHFTIYWCHDLVQPLDEFWPGVKDFG